jgi:hypothetical protein
VKIEHRKIESAPGGGVERRPAQRSGWFDDETYEITADTSLSGKIRLPSVSQALGDCLSDLLRILR